jgi:hypothetical protein
MRNIATFAPSNFGVQQDANRQNIHILTHASGNKNSFPTPAINRQWDWYACEKVRQRR